ncbi:MAG: peptidoglycan-binding protein [Ruminococcus flavefaciens]|nr:peptidoglycan-binding protein [Ruminococcus flavefaciens]
MAYNEVQKRQHIVELQTYLYAISFINKEIPQVAPSGVYNRETIFAVRAFQHEYGLQETGSTDPATWNKIVSVYRSYLRAEPMPYNAFPSSSYVAHMGENGQLIYILQAMLGEICDSYDNAPSLTVCGNYNKDTSDTVRFFQKKVGLPQSGNVDSGTWNMLVTCCEHISNTSLRNKK